MRHLSILFLIPMIATSAAAGWNDFIGSPPGVSTTAVAASVAAGVASANSNSAALVAAAIATANSNAAALIASNRYDSIAQTESDLPYYKYEYTPETGDILVIRGLTNVAATIQAGSDGAIITTIESVVLPRLKVVSVTGEGYAGPQAGSVISNFTFYIDPPNSQWELSAALAGDYTATIRAEDFFSANPAQIFFNVSSASSWIVNPGSAPWTITNDAAVIVLDYERATTTNVLRKTTMNVLVPGGETNSISFIGKIE